MDSRFAVFFFIVGGLDTYLNDCPTDCLQQSEAPERFGVQYADTYFQEEDIGEEIYATYDLPRRYGAFQPTFGASLTSDDDFWIGAGGKWSTERISDSPIFIELSLMPGVYFRGEGPDLGFPLQFRGALGAGVNFGDAGSLTVFFDHRSNANATETNPGIETLGIRYSYQFQ
ncbi:acyloxyacyl hydrolase [Cognatiyoonia sp. IB215182]|uniref:acyloxyacyl hydrolase n=1 Tax=Cognatiyoonia sp. IB215182 TaxID=3097353 RepID=UPI002A129D96|nr:acyloxyacyl hydrolase [Cognatiyoonia sp. IB215182]MDX8353587.1 acyloxyacyl hydrolase [Cognatiyoonia sp. IB215182]